MDLGNLWLTGTGRPKSDLSPTSSSPERTQKYHLSRFFQICIY